MNGASDVVDLLLDQHVQIRRLMDAVMSDGGDPKAKAFEDLANLLERHERGEEQIVHAAVRDELGASEIAAAVAAEERLADAALANLRAMGTDDIRFDSEFAFRDAVLRHADHEEREEFPRLRESLHPSARLALAEELRAVQ